MTMELEPLGNSVSTTSRAYHAIKDGIISLRLPPGMALKERTIAEQLGISKTPVREALLMLQREGWVEALNYRGAIVASLTLRDILDVLEIREALEGLAVRYAAKHFTRSQIAELDAIVMKGLDDDEAIAIESISSFHEYLVANMENERLKVMLANLADHNRRFRKLSVQLPGSIEHSTQEHIAILQAIKARDEHVAEMILRQHLRSLAERFADWARDGHFPELYPEGGINAETLAEETDDN